MSNMGVIEPMEHMSKNCSDAYEMDGVRLGLCVFEMFINVCVIGASAPFAKVVTAITSFTTTMKVLFLNMLFAAVGIAMTRLFILIPQYISINQLYNAGFVAPVQVFHDVSINVNTLITMAITMEFFFYSKWPNPKRLTTILLSSINTFWPWITTIVMYWMEKHEIVKTVPLFAVLEVVNFLSWAIFLGLYFYNRKRYKTMHASTLDEKYQVTVKIRVLRTFLFLSVLTTVRNFLTMTLLIVIITYVVPECLYYAHLYCDHAYDITVALYSVLFIVPLILTQNEFKKQFMKFVGSSVVPTISVTFEHQNQIRNALGENLIVPNTAHTYYRQLAQSWSQRPVPVGQTSSKQALKKTSLKMRNLFTWNSQSADQNRSNLDYRRTSMINVELQSTSCSLRRNRTALQPPQFADLSKQRASIL